MFRKFLSDKRGNFAVLTVIAMVPILGAVALAIDYTELSRQRQMTLNALDAAGIATARRLAQGVTDAQAETYAQEFFDANLSAVDPAKTTLHVTLPSSPTGGGKLKLRADLQYTPIFFPVFQALRGENSEDIDFSATSEIRLKNTLEVALVLDNSGSMDNKGSGSGAKRIDLLKAASKELIDTIAAEAIAMKQVAKPVQFGLVPFAPSVNVGPENAKASWMDTDGLSPIHHENFDWTTMNQTNKTVEQLGGIYYKRGNKWNDEENDKVTRFTLYDEFSKIEWLGCVEMRPYPYFLNNQTPNKGNPASLFVPMFAPDETDKEDDDGNDADNNWMKDGTSGNAATRQAYMRKYFSNPNESDAGGNRGPNLNCKTKPITPLTDVSVPAGLTAIKDAIDEMTPNGNTNVPQGIAWGWRVVSGSEPFTQGRGDNENGNDKVVIVLTDGANTYSTVSNDDADNRSEYAAYGYARNRDGDSRIFEGTSITKFSSGNYRNAMTIHMKKVCENAKDNKIIVMTVALDLSESKSSEKAQIDALKECASNSRFRKDPNDPSKPAKLFWNPQGKELDDAFEEIADELSNLRIVG